MRQYEPIWQKLKSLPPSEATSVGVSIVSPRYWHKRIVKAVVKEKWMDEGYKIWLSYNMDGKYAIMYHHRKGAILTFYLKFSLTATDL